MTRSVVITGLGVICALGDDAPGITESIKREQVPFEYAAADPHVVVAPVKDFEVRRYTGRHKNLRYLNRGAAMAVAAAVQAVQHARLDPVQCIKTGIFAGTGPNLDIGGECPEVSGGRIADDQLAALWILHFLPNTAVSTIAQLIDSHAENLTLGTACTASLQAIGEAYRKIKGGHLESALAGGGDSRLSEGALLAYKKAGALYDGPLEPCKACRPFDQQRHGFIPGEGGAFFVLESAEHAKARGANVLAEVCGFGATLDGHAMTAPQPGGVWAEKAVRAALAEANMSPAQIETLSAHGTSTPLNDDVEATVMQRVFKGPAPQVLALKSWIGHLASACGAVELALCLIAAQTGVWPGIRNLKAPCNPALNFRVTDGKMKKGPLLMQNFGFGGQNAALVVRL